ncbi:MAG: TonB-dependent receptor domain-containing protein, partial [Candidatus Zixiibacteriota bacterium]
MRSLRNCETQVLRIVRLAALVLCGTLLAPGARASLTGEIAGQIVDDRTGQPVVGVRVEIIGSPYEALSDEDGEYYILEVPAGTFSLRFSALGFKTVTKENARVLLDLTTPVNVRLSAREARITDPITVLAERPLVQKDLTATRYTVTAEQMAFLPNAVGVDDVLLNISGALSDADGSLHVRGGRSGALTYIYDGIQVTDPFTRALGLRIVPHFLEEINLTSGGFPAEYGEAGSGVVNAVTREGGSNFTGSVKLYDGSTHQYDRFVGNIGDLGRSDNQTFSANFSGPLEFLGLNRTSFFIAAEGLRDGGFLPHSFSETKTFTGKLSTRPAPNLKLTATGTFYDSEADHYFHRDINGISYDLNLDGLGRIEREAASYGLRASFTPNPQTVLTARVSRFETKFKLAPTHLFDVYWDQWPGFVADSTGAYDQANGTLHVDNYEFAPEYGFTGYTFGDDFNPRYSVRSTKYSAANAAIIRQINNRNRLKIGGEYRKYNIFWDEKQFYNPVPFGEKYNYFPSYGYVFAQHKLEYNEIIINAGLRYDNFSSRVDYLEDPLNAATSAVLVSSPKSQLSPRLGVSHPIAENTILRFNYGYFFQPPRFTTMFTNLDGEINSGFPLIGNPDLKPERTIAYELGLDHSLNNDMVLGITAYYKDIENLVATRAISFDPVNGIVTQFVNEDYSSVKGVDVSLTKRRTRHFSGRLSYSLMVARGNSPSERFAYVEFIGRPDTT